MTTSVMSIVAVIVENFISKNIYIHSRSKKKEKTRKEKKETLKEKRHKTV